MEKRNTFAYAFYARESKKAKNGLSPVELSISVNGSRTQKENANWGTKPLKVKKHIKTLKRKVVCVKDEKEFMSFPSLTAAAEEFNTTIQNISYAIKSGNKARGYNWRFLS